MESRTVVDKAGGRKYSLAVFFAVVGTAGLFVDKLTGGEFLILVSTILGMYGLANVATNKITQVGTPK